MLSSSSSEESGQVTCEIQPGTAKKPLLGVPGCCICKSRKTPLRWIPQEYSGPQFEECMNVRKNRVCSACAKFCKKWEKVCKRKHS
jgi:hypothetical protein